MSEPSTAAFIILPVLEHDHLVCCVARSQAAQDMRVRLCGREDWKGVALYIAKGVVLHNL